MSGETPSRQVGDKNNTPMRLASLKTPPAARRRGSVTMRVALARRMSWRAWRLGRERVRRRASSQI